MLWIAKLMHESRAKILRRVAPSESRFAASQSSAFIFWQLDELIVCIVLPDQ